MLVIYFERSGIVHREMFPPGLMVNQHYYQEVLQCLRQEVCQKHLKRWWNHDWLNHCDSAPQHTALALRQFLATKKHGCFLVLVFKNENAPDNIVQIFIFLAIVRLHHNRILVNKTNRCTEFQFYWYYYSTCFGQPFCPSSGILSRTSALAHFMQL